MPRVLAYTDYLYRQRDGTVFAERAFVHFLGAMARDLGGMQLLGRVDEGPGPARYPLAAEIEFVTLPHFTHLTDARAVVGSMPGAVLAMWRALEQAEIVFVLGPSPHALTLALLALARRRRVVLGVRQNYIAYVRNRHPQRLGLQVIAAALEGAWLALARVASVVAVGAELAERYRRSPRVLQTTVSLVHASDVEAGARAARARSYAGDELVVLSVGRLDAEKNPLLLPEVLLALRRSDRRWRMVICGEGDLAGDLERRLAELGLRDCCELRGYIPLDGGLLDLYRGSHAFLHVSRTEGFPQVLIEAYASGLPSVATAVGGVPALRDCSLLVEPDDAGAAARALIRLAKDPQLRERLISAGLRRAASQTLEIEATVAARFVSE